MNIKNVLLLCLLLVGILALPVQSQTALANPTAANLAPCGLPSRYSTFNASAPVKTFEMISDCDFGAGTFDPGGVFLLFSAGTFTINGNGHSIRGPNDLIQVNGSSAVLNLNNVIIRQAGRAGEPIIRVRSGGRFNGRNIIFTDNEAGSLVTSSTPSSSSTVYLENVQAYDNRIAASFTDRILFLAAGASMTINNGIFLRNSGINNGVIRVQGNGGSMTLQGCMTFVGNVRSNGAAADKIQTGFGGTAPTDSTTGTCPAGGLLASYWLALTPQKKSKKTATPRPSATARPLATTCIDLNLATGIAVHATYGLDSGVQCQRLDGGGIGLQSIVDAGFIDAVDVWGYVEQGVEVCFPQVGELLFLDARTMPRAIAPLAATVINDMTCGAIDSPGSIVLMPPP